MSYITNQWVKMNPFETAARLNELERENASLRADKERLDARRIRLMVYIRDNVWKTHEFVDVDLRAAIDAATKEAQP